MTDPDDLLRMLDLGGSDGGDRPAANLAITAGDPKPPVHTSPTVLDLDDWALRKGREVLADSERMQALKLSEHEAADFFASAFLPDPQLLEGCQDRRRHEFIAQMFETPEYRSLHATTMLQEVASSIAANAFADQFAALKQDEKAGAGKDGSDREMATLRAVGRALNKATAEVEEARETAAAMGMGPGSPGSNDP